MKRFPFKLRARPERVRWLIGVGLSCLLSTAAGAQETPNCLQEVDARRHYGDTLTLVLVDHLEVPRFTLEVPVGLALSIDGVGAEARRRDPLSVCAPEPIQTRFAFIIFNHRTEDSIGSVDGLTIGRMVLRYTGASADAAYAHLGKIASLSGTDGTELPNGFVHSVSGTGRSGSYVMQAQGEVLRPIYVICAPAMGQTECGVDHQWDNGVYLSYWFDYDQVDPANWVLMDRAVREASEAMFAGDEDGKQ